MQKLGRVEATKISKEQAPKQPPMKIVQGTPSNATLANIDTKSIIVDEGSNPPVIYIRGNKRTIKITGSFV